MIYVVLPAFNEESGIATTIDSVRESLSGGAHELRIVLVDDGSTDRTVERAKEAAARGPEDEFVLLQHTENRGLGAALRTGIYWCVERATDSDVVVTLDADNTHPPKLVPSMVARLDEGHDLVIASRYARGAVVDGVPGYRRLLSDAGRVLFRLAFPIPGVRDYTCCFRAFRVGILRRARAIYGDDLCVARGFEAVMDLLLRLQPLGIRACEVPLELHYAERVGRSKMRVMKTVESTLALLARRTAERFGRYSRRTIRKRLALLDEIRRLAAP